MRLTTTAGFRYLGRHSLLTALSVLGIALGVSVVVSIDVANSSARRAFELSAERVTGRATHSIVGPESIDAGIFRRLRVDAGVRPSAPIVEGYVSIRGRAFEVLGIDPFFDRPFRGYTSNSDQLDLGTFIGDASAVLLSEGTAAEMDVKVGDTMHVEVAGRSGHLIIGGLLETDDESERDVLSNLLIADIGTAQQLFEMDGHLSRIDLIVADQEAELERIQAALPGGVQIVRSSTRTETVRQMTRAFEVNLTALSLLALIVGMFLIYNTITFSIVQRRPLIGRLRAIGVTRGEIFRQVVLEACLLGAAGTLLGLLAGTAIAVVLVRMVTQTINDLYYVLNVRSAGVEPFVVIKGIALGMAATVVAALPPAWEASTSPVAVVLQRSEEEVRARRFLPFAVAAGFTLAAIAALLLYLSDRSLVVSYASLFLILIAFALFIPAALKLFATLARPLIGALFGIIGRMAARGVIHNLSRTSVAVAALSIAVAAAVGVGIMVGSFRDTVTTWLDYTLQADLYVQAPSPVFRMGNAVVDEAHAEAFRAIPGVQDVSSIRHLSLAVEGGALNLAAVEAGTQQRTSFRFVSGDTVDIWRRFATGAVIVSEPFAYRTGVGVGDTLRFPTDRGSIGFSIAGVFYDYGSDQGVVMMRKDHFDAYFDTEGLSGISLYLEPGADIGRVRRQVREAAASQDLVIRSNRDLRDASLAIFDRTFAITAVLQWLALAVAFVGVVAALMSLQIERKREFAVLRAEGLTPGQLWRYITLQTGVIGAGAGLLALPLGVLLAFVLVFVINKRSFGWTLELDVPVDILLQGMALAVVASILAGVYPAWRVSRTNPADALRGD